MWKVAKEHGFGCVVVGAVIFVAVAYAGLSLVLGVA